MSSAPLPAFPILGILIGASLFAGAGYVWLSPQHELTPIALPEIDTMVPELLIEELLFNDERLSASSIEVITASSPFAPDRSAYSRTAAPAKVAAPTYKPKFVGKTGKGASIRVLIIWTPGSAPQSISIGDETPWGILKSAATSELQFEGPDGTKTLSMF